MSVDDIDQPHCILTVELHDEALLQVTARHEDTAGARADLSVGRGDLQPLTEVIVASDDAVRVVGPSREGKVVLAGRTTA